ncbi:putative siderochrome-iron transporter [Myriangium duriaei CBS 260.36]|uniref:Siderochrome-iron transporter n=1 Tax=Myriangium duriaei CBS 260.36 TaxID=1168546 RepID=A0A9P4MKH0_9PEZI|nr:putative siderochrome-iron transporter [Myriangium duriaei CBS 260.36]
MAPDLKQKLMQLSKTTPAVGNANANSEAGIITAETVTRADGKAAVEVDNKSIPDDVPNEAAQRGVTQAEAITLTWTKGWLIAAYFVMWLLYFVNAMQNSITSNLAPFVTSDFEEHSLLPVIPIVASAMSAASYLTVAKVLNLFDRPFGLALMTAIATLGLILSATCHNITTYAAAQVFYTIGFAGIIFSVDVITADTSTLRQRGLAYAFTSSPYMISAFAGSKASEGFNEFSWRWGYGCFAIILPFVAAALWGILKFNLRKAKRNGLLHAPEPSGRTFMQSTWYYLVQFDILGVVLLSAGLVLFLLPFALAGSDPDGWKAAHIIVMLVIGLVCLIAFGIVERFVSPVPFVPWAILVSRTVLGTCLLDATYQIAYYCWNDYYTSYLQVVYFRSVSSAGYINSTFNVVSGVWLLVVGYMISYTGRFRWMLFWAVPLYMLGVGLMIYFRNPGWGLGYTIMCQIFISFGGSTMINVFQVAVLAASDHNNAAATLALLGVFGNMGGAVGSSISGAIWTHVFPAALQRLLPADALDSWQDIYDSLDVQLSYGRGDPVREAIGLAYADAQSKMLIAGTAVMALGLGFMFMVRDIKLTKEVQNKGLLF